MTPPRLGVIDSVMIDVLVKVDALPARGSDTLASAAVVATGGGFTVMCAAHRHGVETVYAGKLGTGPLSDLARAALRREEVVVPVEPDRAGDAGFCLVVVDAGGERTFVTAKGAELTLSAQDLDAVAVEGGDIVYVSGYNLVYPEIGPTVSRWLDALADDVVVAFDAGARVSDVPAELLARALRRADWLLCNRAEATALSGAGTIEGAADELLARTRGAGVVIHDGEHGCFVATPTQACVRVAGFRAHAVDTNGAGDTHNGVLLAEIAQGTDVLEAARRANGAAAMVIGHLGPAMSPTRDELTAWFVRFAVET
ncbi:MAG: bifunctional hydroxymethylpyrimidine kinase/phosphomethylpyrimidine kinase [Acidobacteriota bacterium]|nr:bifunctional hydroxymethylpyrimidine kinase/phosphomethylpyrimidine kinase [Acidobacteriota bacterium]